MSGCPTVRLLITRRLLSVRGSLLRGAVRVILDGHSADTQRQLVLDDRRGLHRVVADSGIVENLVTGKRR